MATGDVKSKIGKQDLNLWGGDSSRTFTRRTSDGGTITLHRIGSTVDVLQVYGDGTTPALANLTDALGAIGTSEACLELSSGTWTISADLTIPATITLLVRRGALLSVSSGKTLTLNGPVFAEEQTWYSGAGTVTSYEVNAPGMIKMLAADNATTVLHGMGNV